MPGPSIICLPALPNCFVGATTNAAALNQRVGLCVPGPNIDTPGTTLGRSAPFSDWLLSKDTVGVIGNPDCAVKMLETCHPPIVFAASLFPARDFGIGIW